MRSFRLNMLTDIKSSAVFFTVCKTPWVPIGGSISLFFFPGSQPVDFTGSAASRVGAVV